MTLRRLASWSAVNSLVGQRPDRRWGRASLTNPRSDGHSIADWFEQSPEHRVKLVREAVLDRKLWAPLLRTYVPKKPGATDLRAIDMPTVLDQAVLYLLNDWLGACAEQVLTRVAVGSRRGLQMHTTLLNVHTLMSTRPFVAVIDIRHFFDSIEWKLVDRVISDLPADPEIKELLRALVRVAVVERGSESVVLARRVGVPQGLSVSPILANLVLNEFDAGAGHALSKFGTCMKRYCDDIAVLSPTVGAGNRAIEIIVDRLSALGLAIKTGTGQMVDTREHVAVWLGISFGPQGLDVPEATIEAKASRLQAKVDHGVLDVLGVEDSLVALDQHYRRIVGPERSQAVVASIKGKLTFSAPSHTRKVGIDRLRDLVGEHHHRGHISYGVRPHGKPDGGERHEIGSSAQSTGKDPDIGRIDQW
ncbi:MAG: reverse transcriptase domain-containing protein [Pseudomonadota bacterium]